MDNPTPAEIEAVAKAMWDCGVDEDERPSWDELHPKVDAGLMAEFREQAKAGLLAFLRLRAN